jgi:hypothetical protein
MIHDRGLKRTGVWNSLIMQRLEGNLGRDKLGISHFQTEGSYVSREPGLGSIAFGSMSEQAFECSKEIDPLPQRIWSLSKTES